ncbi:MAG TPA: rod shape-determining protein MreD [Limnochordales bacterium]
MKRERGTDRGQWIALGAVVIGLLVVQLAGLAHLPLWGVRPELLLVFVLGVALQRGALEGLILGMLVGLLHDLPGGHLIGLSAVAYGAACFVVGLVGERVFPDRILVVLGMVALGTLVSQGVYLAGASAFGLPWPPLDGFFRVLAALLGYHLLLTPVVYPICRWASGVLAARGGDLSIGG